jgi:hypothetical protein
MSPRQVDLSIGYTSQLCLTQAAIWSFADHFDASVG